VRRRDKITGIGSGVRTAGKVSPFAPKITSSVNTDTRNLPLAYTMGLLVS
jgi:hypothetical protein